MDKDSDLSQHFAKENEEDVLPEEDQFSKLQNSWGAVRKVRIKCKYVLSTTKILTGLLVTIRFFWYKTDPVNSILLRIRFCNYSTDPEI